MNGRHFRPPSNVNDEPYRNCMSAQGDSSLSGDSLNGCDETIRSLVADVSASSPFHLVRWSNRSQWRRSSNTSMNDRIDPFLTDHKRRNPSWSSETCLQKPSPSQWRFSRAMECIPRTDLDRNSWSINAFLQSFERKTCSFVSIDEFSQSRSSFLHTPVFPDLDRVEQVVSRHALSISPNEHRSKHRPTLLRLPKKRDIMQSASQIEANDASR